MATLLLGAVCLADAFVAPGLFGPLAAAVLAAERLLCAMRSSSTRVAVVWTGIAFGWIAVASFLAHTPLVGIHVLQWQLVSIIALSAMGRLWTGLAAPSFESARRSSGSVGVGLVAVVVIAQLATLFGGTSAPLARVAAAVALELVLIGVVRLLEARGPYRGVFASPTGPEFGAPPSLPPGAIKLDTGIA